MTSNLIGFRTFITEAYTADSAKALGNSLHVDWSKVDLNQFKLGLNVEKEHDDGSELDIVNSEKELAKIVLAHLKEKPDYYTRLKKVEEDGVPANSISAGGVAGLTEPIIRRKPKRLTR